MVRMFLVGAEQPQNMSSIHLSLIDTVAMNLGVFKAAAEYGGMVDVFWLIYMRYFCAFEFCR